MRSFIGLIAVLLLLPCQLSLAAPMEHNDGNIWSLAAHGWSTPPDSPQPRHPSHPIFGSGNSHGHASTQAPYVYDQGSTSGGDALAQSSFEQYWNHNLAGHSHSWASDFSSAPQQLEPTDYDILKALEAQLSSTHASSAGPGDEKANQVPAQDDPPQLHQSKPSTKGLYKEKIQFYHSVGPPQWIGAPIFLRFEHVDPLKNRNQLFQMQFKNDAAVQQAIDTSVFGGKLHWIEPKTFWRMTDKDYRRRWPFQVQSRVLPFVQAAASDGTPLRIHMTQHNYLTRTKFLEGTPIESTPYYMFWGVPKSPRGERPPIVHFGAGYIESSDFQAVDDHLRPLLDRAAPGRAHV